MTTTTSRLSSEVKAAKGDVRTTQHNRSWEHLRHLQKGFENTGIRLFYYDRTIEILMPGKAHEIFTGIIGFLIETFLFQQDVDFTPTGAMTQENSKASAQADRSYEVQGLKLSVEVNFTSGDVSKLKRYQALEVNEVWLWEDGILEVYHLKSDGYEKVQRSLIPALSSIDLQVMSQCILVGEVSVLEATKKLLAAHS